MANNERNAGRKSTGRKSYGIRLLPSTIEALKSEQESRNKISRQFVSVNDIIEQAVLALLDSDNPCS